MDVYIGDMMDKFVALINDIEGLALEVIEYYRTDIIKLLQDQLFHGEDGKGNPLLPYREEEYADYKRTLNPLGVTDLKLTGSFYEHMAMVTDFSSIGGMAFDIISTDKKYKSLLKKYGMDIMTLGDERIENFKTKVFNPFFVVLISKMTGAGI